MRSLPDDLASPLLNDICSVGETPCLMLGLEADSVSFQAVCEAFQPAQTFSQQLREEVARTNTKVKSKKIHEGVSSQNS